MLKITPMSDLHLEFSGIEIQNTQNADVLVLAGDITISEDLHQHPTDDYMKTTNRPGARQVAASVYREFIKNASEQFEHVIYVAGNHEFYGGKFHAGIQYLRDAVKPYGNIHFLECDTVKIKGVTFIGGTLWTDMNGHDPVTMNCVTSLMSDYSAIRDDNRGYSKITPQNTVSRHQSTLSYFGHVLRELPDNDQVVIVSHHSPSHMSIHPQYSNDTIMNGAFHSDLSNFILDNPKIKLWIHGHTHNPFDYCIGETRVVCNPRGYHTKYSSEETGWNPNLAVTV